MKHFLILIIVFFSTFSIHAQDGGKFGLGLSLFYPTGITGKYLLSEQTAIEGNLGLFEDRFYLHGVFLYNFYKIPSESANSNFYIGGGLVFHDRKVHHKGNSSLKNLNRFFNDDNDYESQLGIRVPVGFSAMILDNKLELYGELPFHIYLFDDDLFDVGISLGARYYF